MSVAPLTFYSVWPLFGVPLSRQWDAIRHDTRQLSTLIRAAYADISTTPGDHDLAGWAIGELDFRNRFRIFYDKDLNEFKIQINTGTESVEVWTDALRIRQSDGRVIAAGTGGFQSIGGFYQLIIPNTTFYGMTFAETLPGGGTTYRNASTLKFDSNNFYLSSAGDGAPIVSLLAGAVGEANSASNIGAGTGLFAAKVGLDLQFKSLVAGSAVTISSTGSEVTINATPPNPGFYGITVGQTDNNPIYKNINTVKFNSADFYVSQNSPNTDEVIVNFRGTAAAGSGEANTASNLGAGEGVFATKVGVDLQFKSLVAGTNVSLGSDANTITINSTGGAASPGFYGIIVKESDNSTVLRDDTISFLASDFDVSDVNNKPQVALATNVARLSDVGPGFYGITVGQTDNVPTYKNINTIKFNAAEFYVTQNTPNTDEVVVNFRGSAGGGSGEANTASNLGAGSGVFAAKVGVDLQFKSLVAGTNISLGSDANTVTINSTGSGASDPGFYGIIVEESDQTNTLRDDTIRFLAGDFDVSNVNNKPQVALATNVARTSDIGPGFYGIIVKESDNSTVLRDDTISFLASDFDVSNVNDKPQVALATNVARISDIGPGFYGITVAETDGTPSYTRINKLNFESQWFYVEQNSPNTDEVSINFRGLPAGTGEANTASNLGAGEGIFSAKVGVDLQFKSLVAGTNITLTPTSSTITINSSGSGASDPGFYGIIVQESDLTNTLRDDTIRFLAGDFDVSNVSDKPQIALATNIARLSDIGPGFYGLNVGLSTDTPLYRGINTLKFHNLDFYVDSNTGSDVAQVMTRNLVKTDEFGTVRGQLVLRKQSNSLAPPPLTFYESRVGIRFVQGATTTGHLILEAKDSTGVTVSSISLRRDGGSVSITGTAGFNANVILNQRPATSPSIGFDFDNDTGIFQSTGDSGIVRFASVGAQSAYITRDKLVSHGGFYSLAFGEPIYKITAGDGITIEPSGVSQFTISAAQFYGLTVAETDGTPSFTRINKLNFESQWFYVEQNSPNTDEVSINFRGLSAGTGEANTASNLGAGEGVFAAKVGVDLQFKSLVAGTNVSLGSDASTITINSTGGAASPGFYGIIIKESDNSTVLRDDTISFLASDFDVSNVSDKPQVALATNVARLTDIGPGFYGITVAETDGTPSFTRINKLNFESQWFYVEQNSPNTDEVSINFRGIPAGTGEANTASNLGAGEGIFSAKVGVDLQFKSLVAGTNITLTPSGTEISIAATASGAASPGFYGIIVQESDLTNTLRDDTIRFLASDFDVSDVNSKPQIALATNVARLSDIGPGFYGIIVQESDLTNTLRDDTLRFLANDFDISNVSDKPQIALATNVARLSDIGPGFYGIIVQESDLTNTLRDDTIRFLASDFDVSNVNDKPQIALATNVARLSDIGPGFYGITVGQTNNLPTYKGINTVKFNAAEFYITQNSPNTDEAIVNARFLGDFFKSGVAAMTGQLLLTDGSAAAPAIAFANDADTGMYRPASNFLEFSAGGTLLLSISPALTTHSSDATLLVSNVTVSKNLTVSGGLTVNRVASAEAFYSTDLGEPVYAITAGDGVTVEESAGRQFRVSAAQFYGITVRESEAGGYAKKFDRITFDSNNFYVTSGGDKGPLVSLAAGAVGEANTASNLGAGEGVFAAKVGVDLQFKSLVAGTNISLGSDANTITINSTGGGASDPGFYGVLFKESEAGGYRKKFDRLTFDSASFYITSAADNGPLVSFVDPPISLTFSKDGILAVGAGPLRWHAKGTFNVVDVRASVGTQPTGASVIIDVNKNSTTMFTTQANRPTIAISTNTAVSVPDVTTIADGDYITTDIDQVGSSVAGSDLTVQVWLRRTN